MPASCRTGLRGAVAADQEARGRLVRPVRPLHVGRRPARRPGAGRPPRARGASWRPARRRAPRARPRAAAAGASAPAAANAHAPDQSTWRPPHGKPPAPGAGPSPTSAKRGSSPAVAQQVQICPLEPAGLWPHRRVSGRFSSTSAPHAGQTRARPPASGRSGRLPPQSRPHPSTATPVSVGSDHEPAIVPRGSGLKQAPAVLYF